MKKTNRKKLGNKGFSLVELIVVIAIMAILVGVLAPSLLKNIEKSREAKDMSNLDTVYSAIQNAYADEKAAAVIPSTGRAWTAVTLTGDAFNTEVASNLGTTTLPTFSSKKAKSATLYYEISAAGKVSVKLATATENPIVGTYNTFIIE